MNFNEAYNIFIQEHVQKRKGRGEPASLRRLENGIGYAEKLFLQKVWWPAFGDFQHLHPEYMIHDFKDGFRFIDFAYIRAVVSLAIEIDGIGPHWRNIDKWVFSDHCRRQNDLILDGWKVLRFTVDDIKERPRHCQQILQQFMGKWTDESRQLDLKSDLCWKEKMIVRLATNMEREITSADVCRSMEIGQKTANKWLRLLAQKGILEPSKGDVRVHSYRVKNKYV